MYFSQLCSLSLFVTLLSWQFPPLTLIHGPSVGIEATSKELGGKQFSYELFTESVLLYTS